MSDRRPAIDRVHQFDGVWRWPEDVERFIRDQCRGRTLHVCCGQSQLGDVRIDADPEHNADVIADMQALPFGNRTFETVIIDPPWKSVNIFDRHGLFYECVEKTTLGGHIIHNATWVPESDECRKVGEYRRQDISFGDASIISVFERYPDQQQFSDL